MKATRNYIKSMVASESKKKIRKGRGKQRYSSDSSGSESSSSEDTWSWRSGMSGSEQMHMIWSTGLDPNDSDIEFDPEDKHKYRKQAKKWRKFKGKRRKRWEHELSGRQARATPVIIGTANGMLLPINLDQ